MIVTIELIQYNEGGPEDRWTKHSFLIQDKDFGPVKSAVVRLLTDEAYEGEEFEFEFSETSTKNLHESDGINYTTVDEVVQDMIESISIGIYSDSPEAESFNIDFPEREEPEDDYFYR